MWKGPSYTTWPHSAARWLQLQEWPQTESAEELPTEPRSSYCSPESRANGLTGVISDMAIDSYYCSLWEGLFSSCWQFVVSLQTVSYNSSAPAGCISCYTLFDSHSECLTQSLASLDCWFALECLFWFLTPASPGNTGPLAPYHLPWRPDQLCLWWPGAWLDVVSRVPSWSEESSEARVGWVKAILQSWGLQGSSTWVYCSYLYPIFKPSLKRLLWR